MSTTAGLRRRACGHRSQQARLAGSPHVWADFACPLPHQRPIPDRSCGIGGQPRSVPVRPGRPLLTATPGHQGERLTEPAANNRGPHRAAARARSRRRRVHVHRKRVRPPHGRRHHEGNARGRCALRAPDPALEPEDEALHPHRAQRALHHRPAADADLHRPRLRLRQGDRRARRHGAVRRHQEAGAGVDRRAGHPRRHALRQPALAGRHAHQLPDRLQAAAAAQGARGAGAGRLGRHRHQEGTAHAVPREDQAGAHPRRHPRDEPRAQCRLDRRHQEGSTSPSARRTSSASR